MKKDHFYFGAATSAHQVEGDNVHSDWWRFEHKVQVKEGFVSGKATNHYELFDKDFSLAHKLGHDAHRLSIEWAKVEPREGEFDEKVLVHYKEVFKSLRHHGLKPFVTLFHFTFPTWFADMGGFEKKKNIFYFVRFCKKIGEYFRDDIEYFLTINEPEVYLYYSYLAGKWPPQKKNFLLSVPVYLNLTRAHKAAYTALKAINPAFQIGIAKNNPSFSPGRGGNFFDWGLVHLIRFFWNHLFLDLIDSHQDFIGVNYYFHRKMQFSLRLLPQFFIYPCNSCEVTDMGWEVYPQGVAGALRDLWKRYKKPLLITENGVADKKDRLRPKFISDVLNHLFTVRKEGVNVFGYLHWSLLDNFEWAEGFEPRFGLVEVNYKTFERTPRESAFAYKELIEKYRKEI